MSEIRSTPLERCLDMLGDVPGKDLEQKLTHYIGSYMALQIDCNKLREQLAKVKEQNHRHHEHIINMGAHAGKVEAQLASARKTLADIADPTLALLAETKAKMARDELAKLDEVGREWADVTKLREQIVSAKKLAREVKGSMSLFEPIARREIGNTNFNIMMELAEKVLTQTDETRKS